MRGSFSSVAPAAPGHRRHVKKTYDRARASHSPCHSATANKHQVFGGPLMNGSGSFGGLSGTGILPVGSEHGQDACATQDSPNHFHQQPREKSTATFSSQTRLEALRGSFAPLRMTKGRRRCSPSLAGELFAQPTRTVRGDPIDPGFGEPARDGRIVDRPDVEL
jgi:hypothetical protein